MKLRFPRWLAAACLLSFALVVAALSSGLRAPGVQDVVVVAEASRPALALNEVAEPDVSVIQLP